MLIQQHLHIFCCKEVISWCVEFNFVKIVNSSDLQIQVHMIHVILAEPMAFGQLLVPAEDVDFFCHLTSSSLSKPR